MYTLYMYLCFIVDLPAMKMYIHVHVYCALSCTKIPLWGRSPPTPSTSPPQTHKDAAWIGPELLGNVLQCQVLALHSKQGEEFHSQERVPQFYVLHRLHGLILNKARHDHVLPSPTHCLQLSVCIHAHYMKKAVMVGPDKPAIPGQRLFQAS